MTKVKERVRVLVEYADANWAQNFTDRKSNRGYLFKFNGYSMIWASRKQTYVVLSSTESEYMYIKYRTRGNLSGKMV